MITTDYIHFLSIYNPDKHYLLTLLLLCSSLNKKLTGSVPLCCYVDFFIPLMLKKLINHTHVPIFKP